MPRFAVRVIGENLMLDVIERHWLFFNKHRQKKAGMTTTRFIESESANEAINQVIAIVTGELRRDRRWTESSTLEVGEVREDDSGFELYGPGSGFTFSVEE